MNEQYALLDAHLSFSLYLHQLVARLMILGVPIASLAAAGRLVRRPASAGPVGRENDTAVWGPPAWPGVAAVALVAGMLFLVLQLELNYSLGCFFNPLRLPAALAGVDRHVRLFAAQVRAGPTECPVADSVVLRRPAREAVLLRLAVLGAGAFVRYALRRAALQFPRRRDAVVRLRRVIGALLLAWRLLAVRDAQEDAAGVSRIFAWFSLALLFVFFTLELEHLPLLLPARVPLGRRLDPSGRSSPCRWLSAGCGRTPRAIRYAGLGLFAIVAAKVLLVNLVDLQRIYQIVACLVLGVLMLSGAFVYIKCRPLIEARKSARESEDQP